ncbi:hypothetical protein ACFL2Q_00940 [Thermodesulfobacteriota bacterium]
MDSFYGGNRPKATSLLLTALFVALVSVSAWGQDPKHAVGRLAKARSNNFAPDSSPQVTEAAPIPQWLDNLMTRLPEAEKRDLPKPESKLASHKPAEPDYMEPGGELDEPDEFSIETDTPDNETSRVDDPVTPETEDSSFPKPRDIKPLYSSPNVEGEGRWTSDGMPTDSSGQPLVYKTVYRPSVDYPNSIAHMAVFNMKQLKVRLFIGNTEPGIHNIYNRVEKEDLSKIVAITNAMWMQQHARGAGAIFRGQMVYPMVEGMATLVVYEDNSVDILEWNESIPRHLVTDARQLRHLIVRDGRVVDQIAKRGKMSDSEIGLGGFLVNNNGGSTMRNKFWFLANRTAFGIRKDGNLVFAMGHHISTKDIAKALILAGCTRAIHGDANIHNTVCNFYFRDERNKVSRRERLSPEQKKYTMKRYDRGYAKDFFAFYEKQ